MDKEELKKHYLKVTRRFAILAGIWPYQTKFSKYLTRIVISVFTSLAVASQIAKTVCFFDLDVLVEEIPFATAVIGIFVKQGTYIINETKFKSLLDGMFADWAAKRSKEEIEIMTSYAKRGAFFTSFYVVNAYFCVLMFINLPLVPLTLDKLSPRNESRSRLFIYPAYYALDEEKYYYVIEAHMSFIVIIVLFVYSACDTCYMYAVQHACGLLAVAGYRFKNAVENCPIDGRQKSVKQVRETYKNVCFAIQGHERAIAYFKEIESIHFYYLLICLVMVLIAFSITLVKMSIMEITVDFYKYCSFLIVQLVHIFFLTIQGQFLIDSNEEIYITIYEASWYNVPAKTQLLYALALRRALSPLEITAGGFVTMNLQSFAEIIKASVSYFTMLKST